MLTLSVDLLNRKSGTVLAMALTSQEPRAGFPLTMELSQVGLPKRSWVKISQIRTIAVERIGDCLARMDEASLSRILEGLGDILGD